MPFKHITLPTWNHFHQKKVYTGPGALVLRSKNASCAWSSPLLKAFKRSNISIQKPGSWCECFKAALVRKHHQSLTVWPAKLCGYKYYDIHLFIYEREAKKLHSFWRCLNGTSRIKFWILPRVLFVCLAQSSASLFADLVNLDIHRLCLQSFRSSSNVSCYDQLQAKLLKHTWMRFFIMTFLHF